MQERSTNRIAYVTLIDVGFDPADPEVLLELGMEKPVDWDAVTDDGDVICRKLSFVLTVGHAKVGDDEVSIALTYSRVIRDHGVHEGAHVYVLGLRPTPIAHLDRDGTIVVREPHRDTLETAVGESQNVRRRSWCSDIDTVRIFWSHQGPETAAVLANGAFLPEPPAEEAPRASDDEVLKLCDAFDAFCAEFDPAHDSSVPFIEADLDLEPGPELQLATG